MAARLSPKQTALLAAIGDWHGSFFDGGCTAGSGIWAEALTHEAPASVSATPRGVATVASSLVEKGYLLAGQDAEHGVWWELTELGAAEATRLAEKAAARAAADDLLEETLEVVDGDYVLPAAAEEPAPAAEEPVIPAEVVILTGEFAEPEEDLLGEGTPVIPELSEDYTTRMEGSYTVNEWSEDTADYGTEEWIETKFTDGSWTLRRRRRVSGAWRTDFWGQEAGAEKRVFTTSKAAKIARGAGTFKADV